MRAAASATILLVLVLSGCASMCDSSYDCDFHAYGGLRDRLDRSHGRVGSVFAPASAMSSVLPTTPSMGSDASVLGSSGTGDYEEAEESEEPNELQQRLLDQLDKMDDLPVIPGESDSEARGAI